MRFAGRVRFVNPEGMSPLSSNSIALLIDADNSPAGKIDFIMAELATYGVVNIRRAYGNWKKRGLLSWENQLHEHGIQPQQFFDLVKGKNATDMGLLVDAMDILYTKDVQTFALVSSDCDFTPLARRLREDGKEVIGFGERKTPEPFINSCTKFVFLDDAEDERVKAQPAVKAGDELKNNHKLMTTLRNAVRATQDEDGWSPLSPVGQHLSNQGPFDHRTYGFKKLSDLFAAIDSFEVRENRSGGVPRIFVRRRPDQKG